MKPIKKAKGMALMEVLITMLVFALALIPLIKLQVLSMDATRAGFYKTETAAAAESMMDYLMTDVGAIFHGKWDGVTVLSGTDCGSISKEQEKIACEILNPHNAKSHSDKNALLCVFGKRPTYEVPKPTPSDPSNTEEKKRDQYLISIRAIWYSGKRQNPEDSKDPKKPDQNKEPNTYNDPLKTQDCGSSYDSKMTDVAANILSKDNIDYIEINMAY